MNSRPLSQAESQNLAAINRAGFPSALLFITETGLRKSILDATDPVRVLLKAEKVHDFGAQGQGDEHKRILPGIVHSELGPKPIDVSLYRPVTKRGDPRIWFSRFKTYSGRGDACAIFVVHRRVHILNLTRSPLVLQLARGEHTALSEFFFEQARETNAVAEELLRKLRAIAATPIEAVCAGPTAVGRSIETALGISINSSRQPDFQGIELKSGRAGIVGRENRATLFACVPDWSISRCKSSREILDEFGYERGSQFKLYCTVSTRSPNSQGLVFELDEAPRLLREKCALEPKREVAVWRLKTLEDSLTTKHRETFWIKVTSAIQSGREHFQLKSVTHTRHPNLPQLERLLGDGSVTMDHLIKRKPSGGAQEKGPLFKIFRPRIQELFLGEPRKYDLV